MERARAEELTTEKIKRYVPEYSFEFTRARYTLGQCFTKRKIIKLSLEFVDLNTEERVLKTILHEIAHALTPGHSHDRKWQVTCEAIWAEHGIHEKAKAKTGDAKHAMPWVGTCPECGREHPRLRKPKVKSSCGKCSRRYDERFLLEFKRTNGEK